MLNGLLMTWIINYYWHAIENKKNKSTTVTWNCQLAIIIIIISALTVCLAGLTQLWYPCHEVIDQSAIICYHGGRGRSTPITQFWVHSRKDIYRHKPLPAKVNQIATRLPPHCSSPACSQPASRPTNHHCSKTVACIQSSFRKMPLFS